MSAKIEQIWASDEPTAYECLAEVEWVGESYQFDMTRVYQHRETREVYYAEDTGCSCPSPFEDATEDDLEQIARIQDWYDYVKDRTVIADSDDVYQYPKPTPASALESAESARRAIQAALKEVR